MIYYKLTDADGNTRNGMHWAKGVTNRATGKGKELCTDGYVHVYDTPEQAAFMRPVHVSRYTRLWKVKSRCKGITDGTKRGIKSCTVIEEIELPKLTTEQCVEIGIRASLLVYKDKRYVRWAEDRLSGKDRTVAVADAVAAATDVAYTTDVAAYATDAVACAADAATAAAYVADAAAAAYAARAAAYATDAGKINLVGIIEKVLK